MIWSFALAMGIILIAVPLKLMGVLSESVEMILGAVFVALAIMGGFIQFSAKCPNCGSRIGFQSRLLLPSRCTKCGVSFRGSKK